ncbi:ATP-binding cassette domain-containing protein [Tetragenococcus halophilus]|uniref:sulfate/molybdate ABC transporter ATP-binding protein n=1 Tax=Tetragenococcus halophilus TaxID=51669 RepID=UPI001F3311F5|nr:ATP-binding cassette domain-containing protein [Tetragenococcus halophilus]MCF1684200.1 ATP-binding cassette domain-containing protein [Tetragenococcus halophilus]
MSLEINIEKKLNSFTLNSSFSMKSNHTALLGASGSGKSMILKCIAGIETPDRGVIKVNGRTLFDDKKGIYIKPQKRKVGYLFQDYALFPNFTVRKNISCVKNKGDKKTKVASLLQRFDIEEIADSYPAELSGGQKQRVALARLLASEPEILMLDEPFSALDTFLKEKVEIEMKNFLAEFSGDVIMVTHNRSEAYRLCEKLVILDEGQTIEKGDLKEIFEQPQHLATSKLTGCKNFSRIKKITEHQLFARDWGVQLQTEKTITDDIGWIGVRAHDFYDPFDQEVDNAFSTTMIDTAQTLFERQHLCQSQEAKETIWWKVDKSQAQETFSGRLAVLPKNIQLLKVRE